MPWTRTSRGWWRLQLDRCDAPILERIGEVPGVSATARLLVGKVAHDVTISAHRTAFFTQPMAAFMEYANEEPEELLDDVVRPTELWKSALEPRTYQAEAAEWLVQGNGGILGDVPGLGKTVPALIAAKTIQEANHGAPILIIGPQFTRDVWRQALVATGALRVVSEDETAARDGVPDPTFFVCTGSKAPIGVDDAMVGCKYIFIHYDILDGWKHVLTRPLRMKKPCVAIVDEIHWARNPKSKRGIAVNAIVSQISTRIGLTGTVFVNTVGDMWSILSIICGTASFGSHYAFKERYTQFEKTKWGFTSHGSAHQEELKARLESCYLRRTHADVGTQMPQLTRTLWKIDAGNAPMEAALKKYVGKNRMHALEHLREHFRRGSFGQDTLAVLMAWRNWTTRQKVLYVAERAASLMAEGESVVIFAWQRATVEHLAELIGKQTPRITEKKKEEFTPVLTVHGGMDQKHRDTVVHMFQNRDYPSALIATSESLKEGVTLTHARKVIVVDLDWIPSVMLQLEARVHRLGQTLPCESIWCIVERSADELIVEHLLEKALTEAEATGNLVAADAFADLGLDISAETREETMAADLLHKWGGL